jgi:hypothetical protein
MQLIGWLKQPTQHLSVRPCRIAVPHTSVQGQISIFLITERKY